MVNRTNLYLEYRAYLHQAVTTAIKGTKNLHDNGNAVVVSFQMFPGFSMRDLSYKLSYTSHNHCLLSLSVTKVTFFLHLQIKVAVLTTWWLQYTVASCWAFSLYIIIHVVHEQLKGANVRHVPKTHRTKQYKIGQVCSIKGHKHKRAV